MYQVTVTVGEGHFLWDLIEDKCTVTSDLNSIGHELEYQQILENISRYIRSEVRL